mmetsp:Transcript_121199/g.210487  ORF Transcript_121199/g.210487 Transcript_121199/m.210487 type:complete len:83 (+) Transcript_121199:183-431(+)
MVYAPAEAAAGAMEYAPAGAAGAMEYAPAVATGAVEYPVVYAPAVATGAMEYPVAAAGAVPVLYDAIGAAPYASAVIMGAAL